jgi:hypothetical protein
MLFGRADDVIEESYYLLRSWVRFDVPEGARSQLRNAIAWFVENGKKARRFSALRSEAFGPGCVRRALYQRQSYRDIGFAITERQSAQSTF